MMTRRVARRWAVAVVLASLVGMGVAPSASAEGLEWYRSTILSVSKSSMVNYKQILGSCQNFPCSVKAEQSATRSIGVTAGLSRAGVAAELGIGKAETVSIATKCSATKSSAGDTLTMYPSGTKYTYRVKKETLDTWNYVKKTEYVTLVAFNPTGVRCATHY